MILVGAGRHGLGAHLPALAACGSLRLTGIVDTKARIAQLSEIPRLTVPMHESLDAVLVGPKPDLAIVATPHDCHVPLTQGLLRARVPTLLEKPPARSAPELATLLQLSRDLGTPLATSLPLHFRDRYRRFARLLGSPLLTDAEVYIRADVPSWPGTGSWRLSRTRAGGGVLIDLGYHYLELLVACLGPPDDRSVRLTKGADIHCEVEDEARVSLWFAAKRLRVQVRLRSGSGLAKDSDLSIKQDGRLLYQSSESGPGGSASGRERAPGPLHPAPAASQLAALLSSGFLDGRGDWYQTLLRQYEVMSLLDDLYAAAEYMADPMGTAGMADIVARPDPAGRPERTPA